MNNETTQVTGIRNSEFKNTHKKISEPSMSIAAERLNLSRINIRKNININKNSQPEKADLHRKASGVGTDWLHGLKSIPGGAMLIHAVNIWWSKQPLRTITVAAADAAKTVLQPVAQRHPVVLVAGAFVFGGVLVWSRPWRWVSKPIVVSSLLGPLFSKVIANMPAGIWTEAFNSMVHKPHDQPLGPA